MPTGGWLVVSQRRPRVGVVVLSEMGSCVVSYVSTWVCESKGSHWSVVLFRKPSSAPLVDMSSSVVQSFPTL